MYSVPFASSLMTTALLARWRVEHTFPALQYPRAEDVSSVLCHQRHLAHWVYTPVKGKFARLSVSSPASIEHKITDI